MTTTSHKIPRRAYLIKGVRGARTGEEIRLTAKNKAGKVVFALVVNLNDAHRQFVPIPLPNDAISIEIAGCGSETPVFAFTDA